MLAMNLAAAGALAKLFIDTSAFAIDRQWTMITQPRPLCFRCASVNRWSPDMLAAVRTDRRAVHAAR